MHTRLPGGHALPGRRADSGTVRLTGRDVNGLILCAEQYGAPYDLLAAALDVRPDRLRAIVARWAACGLCRYRHPHGRPDVVLIVTAVAVAGWPLTIAAAAGYLAAWLRGWPPARLWHAAAWTLPMTAVYAIGQALRLRAWQAVALAPVNDWGACNGTNAYIRRPRVGVPHVTTFSWAHRSP